MGFGPQQFTKHECWKIVVNCGKKPLRWKNNTQTGTKEINMQATCSTHMYHTYTHVCIHVCMSMYIYIYIHEFNFIFWFQFTNIELQICEYTHTQKNRQM